MHWFQAFQQSHLMKSQQPFTFFTHQQMSTSPFLSMISIKKERLLLTKKPLFSLWHIHHVFHLVVHQTNVVIRKVIYRPIAHTLNILFKDTFVEHFNPH
jgi:hypothetical protein